MGPVVLAILQVAAIVGCADACVRPRTRKRLAAFLLVLGLLALTQSLLAGGDPRTLDITTTYTAYQGMQVAPKDFLVDQATAPAWAWGLLCGIFALAWAAWAWRHRESPPSTPFGAPLALALSGCALIFLLEKAAAPIGLVSPFALGQDKALLPATLAAAVLLTRQRPRVLEVILGLSLFVATTRMALALFATLASQGAWGTHVDVSTIEFVAVGTQPVEFEPGSLKQWWWLIAVPDLVVFPAIYMMSVGGIAFAVMMAAKQRQVDQARSRSTTAIPLALLLLPLALAAAAGAQVPSSTATTKPTSSPSTRITPPAGWLIDYSRARELARAQGKDLLLGFVGQDWCRWSQRLRQEVFDNESFQQKAPLAFVLVQVDFPKHHSQDPARREQNRRLKEKFQIQAYPTIYLADAAGRPYARTGYREVGPEIYLGQLLELREIRRKRDDEFQKAAAATGPERARYLAAGLEALAAGIPLDDYLPIIDEILALDPEDKESLKARYAAVKRRVLREAAMQKLTRELDRMAANKQWREILDAVAKFKQEQKPEGNMLQELVWIEAVACYEQDDKTQARAKFEEVMTLDPNSDMGKQARNAIQSLGN